jgi:hypothetical protein
MIRFDYSPCSSKGFSGRRKFDYYFYNKEKDTSKKSLHIESGNSCSIDSSGMS